MKILEVDLFSAAWEVRHGAAMALREILKHQGKFGGMQGNFSYRGMAVKNHADCYF